MQWKTSALIAANVRKFFSSMAVCCVLCWGTSLVLAGERLWTFDSDADLADWEFSYNLGRGQNDDGNSEGYGSEWYAEDGVLFVTGDPRPDIGINVFGEPYMRGVIGDVGWTDYTIEMKARIDDGNWGNGVIFREQSKEEYYLYYMNADTGVYELWRHKPGGREIIDVTIPAVNVTYEPGVWYDIKVDVTGNESTLWVNGTLQGVNTIGEDASLYPAGRAGIFSMHTRNSFDDFKVSGADIFAPCDFDQDNLCNVNDINLMFMQGDLVAGVADPDGTSQFNLSGDTSIDGQDISRWLGLAAENNGYGTAPYLRGDTDHLGNISPAQRTVDITDFNALASNYAPQGTPSGVFAPNWHQGSFDGDGDVDLTDFNFLAGNYDTNGYGAGQAGATPEPTTALLLAIGGLFLASAASARWLSR